MAEWHIDPVWKERRVFSRFISYMIQANWVDIRTTIQKVYSIWLKSELYLCGWPNEVKIETLKIESVGTMFAVLIEIGSHNRSLPFSRKDHKISECAIFLKIHDQVGGSQWAIVWTYFNEILKTWFLLVFPASTFSVSISVRLVSLSSHYKGGETSV